LHDAVSEAADGPLAADVAKPDGSEAGPFQNILPSAGCRTGDAGISVGLSYGTVATDGGARTYLISVPTSYRPDVPLPLIFAWHDQFYPDAGSIEGWRDTFGLEKRAPMPAIFAYPVSWESDGTWDIYTNYRSNADVAFFDELLASLTGRYCIDRDHIFSVGIGFGGSFTNLVGCLRGNFLRAIFASSGLTYMLDGPGGIAGLDVFPTCQGQIGVSLVYGGDDYMGENSRHAWALTKHCTPRDQWVDYCIEYHGCAPNQALGTEAPLTACHTIPAGSRVWQFFSSFP